MTEREHPRVQSGRLGGPTGNERLTGMTAAVLLGLLAVEGATLIALGQLLPVHIFVGMLLIPPVALKLASTGWRFVRYYAGSRSYVLKGPPHPAMRLLAPAVVLTTAALFATGVVLILLGPSSGRGLVLTLHKASFFVWVAAMSIHVLVYVVRIPRLVAADSRLRERVGGSVARRAAVAGALVAGVALAVTTYPLAGPWLHGG